MIHPETEVRYIDAEKGYGLFAARPIPRGTIIWVLDELDREIAPAEMQLYSEQAREILLTYSFRNRKGNYVFCWDNGRFINHSFNANCCLTPYEFEIAIRDIEAGEEITDDYGYLNIIEPFEARPEGGSRTVVYPDDLLRYAPIWDERLQAAFPDIIRVDQPLRRWLHESVWETARSIAEGRGRLDSIRNCFFEGMVDPK